MGACWLACRLYKQLKLDRFFAPLLPDSGEGTNRQHIPQTLVCYRLIDPGSEWRLHRQWFEQSSNERHAGQQHKWAISLHDASSCLGCPPQSARMNWGFE
jgi:hypothetical protein